MSLEISTEIKSDIGSLSTYLPRTLVLEQSLQWQEILSAFERGDYAPKNALQHSVRSLCNRFPVSGRRILDAGCGTGLVGMEFAECGANILGMDILPFAVEQATTRFPAVLGDVCTYRHDLPFDAALCSMVLMLVDDMAGAVRNLSSQVSPMGYLYVAILNPLLARDSYDGRTPHSRLARWRFSLNGKFVEIEYFLRTLEEYIHFISQEFTIEYVGAVPLTGGLLSLTLDTSIGTAEECLWVVARKRRLANGGARVLEVHAQ